MAMGGPLYTIPGSSPAAPVARPAAPAAPAARTVAEVLAQSQVMAVLDELDDITWKIGAAHISLRNMIEGTFTAVIVLVMALWVSSAFEARLMRSSRMDLSLRKIAATHGETYYRGEIAEALVAHAKAHGGAMTDAQKLEGFPAG